mmetsp:Transcript_25026/g.80680  ORF Transcript_25026/g.80680 Transcript_25026/m.80680 type:complete len:229 (+) Transcript_25026:647-1333(+)
MSFWKQEPPKPTDARKKWDPMRTSDPTARATSPTSAPLFSHRAEMLLMEEMRCAKKALATSLLSSLDHRLVVMMRSRGTHRAYTDASVSMARRPDSVWEPPMRTREGFCRSATAVPSAKNSGLDNTSNDAPSARLACSTRCSECAVRTGTVDFSTTILEPLATRAIWRAASSRFLMLDARPLPIPNALVGVLTQTKIMSASTTSLFTSEEKNRFFPRCANTSSSRPGS